jgi:serpin B
MNRTLIAAVAGLALSAAACGSASAPNSSASLLEAANVAMARPAPHYDFSALGKGSRAFGYALAGRVAPDAEDGNFVFSPVSAQIAFAMLCEGARGDTAASIAQTMHFPSHRRAAFNALLHDLSQPGAGNTLDVGDALFVDPDYPVRPSYLATLKKWYGTGVYQTQFPSPALDDINGYVDDRTHGRIPMVLQSLEPDDVLVLVNTVYLNGRWQSTFDPRETTRDVFHPSSTTSVRVKTMHQDANLPLAAGNGWEAVRLPYRGNRLSMEVLLPSGNRDPLPLLDPKVLAVADRSMNRYDVALSLPRWDIDTRMDAMVETLQKLGMSHTFNGSGDFSGITPGPGFDTHEVVQEANITVAEKGTVAAAATAIVNEQISAGGSPLILFTVDHPFAYVILDNTSGAPLFEGIVSDPSRVGH